MALLYLGPFSQICSALRILTVILTEMLNKLHALSYCVAQFGVVLRKQENLNQVLSLY
jgi:hypothetical protein